MTTPHHTSSLVTLLTKCILLGIVLLHLHIGAISAQTDTDPSSLKKGEIIPVPAFHPVSKLMGRSLQTNIFEDNFEAGSSKWTTTGGWQIGTPLSGPMGGSNSLNVAGTNLEGTYSNNANDVLTNITAIPLPPVSQGSHLNLMFDEWYETESCCDHGYVELSVDGGNNWNRVNSRSGGGTSWRVAAIDLNTYAGQPLTIRFLFHSDSSSTKSGWYIDNVRIVLNEPSPVEVTIPSLNYQNFPFLYMDIGVVDSSAECADPIPQSGFKVTENGIVQTDFFSVIPPNQGEGTRLADIVFLMDNSESMRGEQRAVKENVFAFVDALNSQGVNSALGLTRYGQSANGGRPIFEDNGSLTLDAQYFESNVWLRNVIDGGNEPGYQAIVESAAAFQFRPGAARFFIIITDEQPDQGNITRQQALAALQNNNVTLFVLTVSSYFSKYTDLVADPSKQIFDIYSNFSQILTTITNIVGSTYRVSYRTLNPALDSVERVVQAEVTCGTNRGNAVTRYTPGTAPQITRTNNTIDLSTIPQVSGTPLMIAADVVDLLPPFLQTVTLYYRSLGKTIYSIATMTNVSGDRYEAQIPGATVVEPGIDYYITATDGTTTSSDPSNNPASNPHQIAVLPNVAPVITHTPVSSGNIGQPLIIDAEVVDITNHLAGVTLHYRQYGALIYTEVPMTPGIANHYSEDIPGIDMTAKGVEYYISAIDDYGLNSSFGTPSAPLLVTVVGASLCNSTVETVNMFSFAHGSVPYPRYTLNVTCKSGRFGVVRTPSSAAGRTCAMHQDEGCPVKPTLACFSSSTKNLHIDDLRTLTDFESSTLWPLLEWICSDSTQTEF